MFPTSSLADRTARASPSSAYAAMHRALSSLSVGMGARGCRRPTAQPRRRSRPRLDRGRYPFVIRTTWRWIARSFSASRRARGAMASSARQTSTTSAHASASSALLATCHGRRVWGSRSFRSLSRLRGERDQTRNSPRKGAGRRLVSRSSTASALPTWPHPRIATLGRDLARFTPPSLRGGAGGAAEAAPAGSRRTRSRGRRRSGPRSRPASSARARDGRTPARAARRSRAPSGGSGG